jgi:hypothetical protein
MKVEYFAVVDVSSPFCIDVKGDWKGMDLLTVVVNVDHDGIKAFILVEILWWGLL